MDMPKPMQTAVYAYLSLPTLIFLLSWTKLYIAVPLSVLVIYSLFRILSGSERGLRAPEPPPPSEPRQCGAKGDLAKYAIALGLIFFWVLISGVGRFSHQTGDHVTRNGLFELLVESSWPVIIDSPHYDQPVGLIYYIGFWLPPAIVGKAFGIAAGYFAQVVWATAGIFLFYYAITVKYVKKATLWPLAVIVFFSGLDVLGKYLMGTDIITIFSNNSHHIEWWVGFPVLQYSSMTSQLFWVFNQAVPIWLYTVVIISQKDNRHIALVLALAMLHGPLPALGLAVLVLFMAGKSMVTALKDTKPLKASLRSFFKEHITLENCAGVVLASVFLIYYLGTFVTQDGSFREWSSFGGALTLLVVFFAVEAGLYLAAVAPLHKKSYLFHYVVVMLLFICPWYIIGYYNDFGMRVSIPALVVLMCLVIDTLAKAKESSMRKLKAIIICLLIIGGVTPMNEIVRSVSATIEAETHGWPQGIHSLNPIEEPHVRDQYYGYADNFFFTHIGR